MIEHKIDHPRDIEYFRDFPAPLMELMQSAHFTNINSTITFFGPMLYFFARAIGAEKVLEIGHAEGYSSHYLAHAVTDNATRFKMEGNKYYGIDIRGNEQFENEIKKHKLLAEIQLKDSMTLSPDSFPNEVFDIIFQDGNHDTEHVVHEFKTMWPQLKGNGNGYWIAHDVFGPAEEGWHEIKNKIIGAMPLGSVEILRIFCPYGLAIIRKMEGFDNNKRFWVEDKGMKE